ncbi:CcoQ/FixQ family Cbb3-type cytochrome c oxidase assembly chaperone [Vibrio vulnificus]|nr:CcoQ/FixQ family Cbb3-type cytochrome c oxidase assembly chaperone [Vibrio vulnificus]MCU8540531.1 CcoQ/FixQ family Cbb3-type cytochrome c oxidase assembly chaperone [Vibrio vulnificus]MCU8543928.1 CcoQ/FixQ family Cbb3-type cytochrome c oxidase assembly chaperone [Vibrio vulnificus]
MDFGTIHSIYTVVLFVSFIGIVAWAYSKKRKASFDEAANLVFSDEEKSSPTKQGVTK